MCIIVDTNLLASDVNISFLKLGMGVGPTKVFIRGGISSSRSRVITNRGC